MWALEGLRSLRAHGRFIQAERGRSYLADFADLCSPIEQFVGDICQVGVADYEVTVTDLYHAWVLHCHGEGIEAGGKGTFGARLKAAFPDVEIRQRGSARREERRIRVYRGIRLDPAYVLERTRELTIVR
jgi:phage/plasmid-associated DNA primase